MGWLAAHTHDAPAVYTGGGPASRDFFLLFFEQKRHLLCRTSFHSNREAQMSDDVTSTIVTHHLYLNTGICSIHVTTLLPSSNRTTLSKNNSN
jgi:hypothetical protein